MKQCFSFIRFSSMRQADGTSEDRQLEIAPRVAKEKGWLLREDLAINLKGVSSYKGQNRKPLMQVAEMARQGVIPQGTVMILESIDRASRFSIDEGRELFRQILLSGVEIYNDYTNKLLTKASLNNLLDLMELIFQLDASFKYSDMLSQRITKAWRMKRDSLYDGTANKIDTSCVQWIDKKTWKPIPEKVKVVRKIFDLYNDGYGSMAIVRKLHYDKLPSLGYGKKGWNNGVVWLLLHNRAVIGEFQPYKTHRVEGRKSYLRTKIGSPIPNYYPAIIPESLFYSVQAKFGHSKRTFKADTIGNLFSGVAYCACKARMFYSGSTDKSGTRRYYMCSSKVKGLGCNAPTIRYEPLENLFLTTIAKNAHRLFNKKPEDSGRLMELRGRVGSLEAQINNITQAVIGGKATKALVEAQANLETELDDQRAQLQIEESQAMNKVRVDTSKDFVTVTVKQLAENKNVRRLAQDFILTNVKRIEFPLDRQAVEIQYNSDTAGEMVQTTLDALPLRRSPLKDERVTAK
jgi:hypothetical protein